MEKIEQLLKIEMGSKFDTRKTLNRSDKDVPQSVINEIESGKFTCEMINNLSKSFPIFRYQTQITIHGNFPEITRSYIGGYKNIFQNQNGSLGVKYSAIDVDKITTIKEKLKNVSEDRFTSNTFHFLQNSTDRVFRKSTPITKETKDGLILEYKQLAEIIKQVNIYGIVNLYIQPLAWGGYTLNLDIHPLAIPLTEIDNLTFALLGGIDSTKYNLMAIEAENKRKEQAEQYRLETEKNQLLRQQKQQRKAEFLAPYIAVFGENKEPTPLNERNIICRLDVIEPYEPAAGEPEFVFRGYAFYKISGKGSFGKLKVVRYHSLEYPKNINTIIWDDHKQMKLSEIKYRGYLVNQ